MLFFAGQRHGLCDFNVTMTTDNRKVTRLVPWRAFRHMPRPFAWGSRCEGARSLACAMLHICCENDVLAARYADKFVDEILCRLSPLHWELNIRTINFWLFNSIADDMALTNDTPAALKVGG